MKPLRADAIRFHPWTELAWRHWALRVGVCGGADGKSRLRQPCLPSIQQVQWEVRGGNRLRVKAWNLQFGGDYRACRAGARGLAEGFAPGTFQTAQLHLTLPEAFFPNAATHLRDFLRATYLPANLRRVEETLYLELAPKALKKRVVLEGRCTSTADASEIWLRVSSRFDLRGFLSSFGHQDLYRQAHVTVSDLRWFSPGSRALFCPVHQAGLIEMKV